jgi:hypothetical protein
MAKYITTFLKVFPHRTKMNHFFVDEEAVTLPCRHELSVVNNLVPRACDPWEGNEGSGIIRIRHTENCMSTELRMRWQKQNKLFEIFYCFVYKMMIFSGFWWKC